MDLLPSADFEGVDIVVEDERFAGFDHRAIHVKQAGVLMPGQEVQQAHAYKFLVRPPVVLARCGVRVRVLEVDDLPGVVAHRGEHHMGVEQAVESGPQTLGGIHRATPVGRHCTIIGTPAVTTRAFRNSSSAIR